MSFDNELHVIKSVIKIVLQLQLGHLMYTLSYSSQESRFVAVSSIAQQ